MNAPEELLLLFVNLLLTEYSINLFARQRNIRFDAINKA